MSPMKLILVVVLAAAFALPAWSEQRTPLDFDEVRVQQLQIRADIMASQGRYADMPASKRDQIVAKQDSLLKLIDGKHTESELSDRQLLETINSLEWIQAAINDTEDERVVCKSVKLTGSHVSKKVCKTVAQMREEREDARNSIERRALCTEGQSCASRE